MKYILKVIKEHFPNIKIEIDAQSHAVGYYEKGVFKVTSEPFIESGINHIKMEYEAK